MILEGFKFSINFLKDNFRKLITILSIPIILELMLNSFNSFSETDEGSIAVFLEHYSGGLYRPGLNVCL